MVRINLLPLVLGSLAAMTILVALSPLFVVSPLELVKVLGEARFSRALVLSLLTASIASVISVLLALPVAYYVSRKGGFMSRVLASLHLLFLGMPPVGLGISLLILLSRAPLISRLGDHIIFSPWAIIVAQSAVVAPISISLLVNVFTYIPRILDELASLYGAQGLFKFRTVILPVALPGIVGAWALSFFRAVGEFGATLVLAGNIPGYTETLPIAMYNMISLARVDVAASLLLLTVAMGTVLIIVYSKLQEMLLDRIRGLVES